MLKYQTLSGTEVHIAKFWSSTWANSHQVYSKSLNHAKTRQKLHMRLWKDSTSPIINFDQIGAAHFTGGLDVKTIRTLQVTLQTHLAGVRTPWAPYHIFSARFCAPFRWNKRQSEIISVDDCSIPNRQFSNFGHFSDFGPKFDTKMPKKDQKIKNLKIHEMAASVLCR